MKRLPRISAVAILLLLAPLVAGLVAMPLLWCIRVWHWPDWLVALLGCVLSAGLMYGLWRLVVELIQQRFRFTLRSMIVAVAVFGLLLGTVGAWWVRFAAQYSLFHRMMAYGSMFDTARPWVGSQRQKMLYRWFGYDPFETEHNLLLSNDRALKEALRHAEEFTGVAQLSFNRGVTASGFAEATGFNEFPGVKWAEFIEANIDTAGLARLAEWTKLRELVFNGCPQVTDAGLAELTVLPNLESLSLYEELGGMKLGDAGLANVGKMHSLKKLTLVNMPDMTDAGFAHLHGLSNLKVLIVRVSGLTPAGLRALHAALPNCRIDTDVVEDGPLKAPQVVVRQLGDADAPVQTITDSDTIAALVSVRDAVQQGAPLEPQLQDQPSSADFELTFNVESRTVLRLRFDGNTLQELKFFNRWNHWQLTPEQAAELKDLVRASE